MKVIRFVKLAIALAGAAISLPVFGADPGYSFSGLFYSYFNKSTPDAYPDTTSWYGVNSSSILGISGAANSPSMDLTAYSGANTTYFINQSTPTNPGDWAYAVTAGSNLGAVLTSNDTYAKWTISFASSSSLELEYAILDKATLGSLSSYAGVSGWSTLLTSNTSQYTYDLGALGKNFTLDSGETVVFRWVDSANAAYWLDDVIISATPIPEPSTYALFLGVATLGLVGWRRFRRK